MLNLTDINILKSFKYIRKIPDGKGGWKYIYEEPKQKVSSEDFGPEVRGYKGKPQEALNYLLKHKNGQVLDVVAIRVPMVVRQPDGKWGEEIGSDGKPVMMDASIDLVWGTKTRGLYHILDKHYVNHNDYNSIEECFDSISYSLDHFDNKSKVQWDEVHNRFKIRGVDKKGNAVAVGIEIISIGSGKKRKDYIRHFILTSFDSKRGEYDKELTPQEISKRKKNLEG